MNLLLIVSGKKSEIIKVNNLESDIKIKKIDEKDLSRFSFINSLIKQDKIDKLYFSVYSIDYLRFEFFMKLFLFLNNLPGEIIDQSGRSIKFSKFKFLLKDFPKFFLESFLSVFVVIYYHIIFAFKSEKI